MVVKVGDVDFYCERYGSGMPAVMVHGWSPDHRIMKNCMETVFSRFPGAFDRLYFDLPGMGRTKGGDGIACSDDLVDRIADLIDRTFPGKKYLVVGESYGGYLARRLAQRNPERIAGMCLVCPVARQETQRENAPAFQVLEKDPGIDGLMDDDDRRYFTGISVRQTALTLSRFREEILPGLKAADHPWIDSHIAKQVRFDPEVDEPGARYGFPALFLAGRQDSSVGYSDLWKIIELYPRASFCALDMAGHNLQIEQPELFASLVREWLERVLYESARP